MKNQTIKGESLAFTISYAGKGATLKSKRWRYTRQGELIEEGNEELYDHMNDPEEHINLAQDPENRNTLVDMREKFEMARKKARTKI